MVPLHRIPAPAATKRRTPSRTLAALLAAVLALAPLSAVPQVENLPRLGEAGGEDLSPDQERRLGEQVMRELRREGVVADDAEVDGYLNRLGARLTATQAANGYTFDFFLVRDASLNAFALPGGHIGVHSGLVVASQTESELSSVLGHEIGHVTQRHIARMLTKGRQVSNLAMAGMIVAMLAARSNPAAAMGAASMLGGAQQQSMLSFGREAEREADRVGVDILRQAGFDPNGMVAFFGRLQKEMRFYEGAAPAYMRSHPLTVDRMADMQARVQDLPYRQSADSQDFRMVQAKLRAQASTGIDALRAARERFERGLVDKTVPDEAAAWYGIAVVAVEQRDFAGAERAIGEARKRLLRGHPFVERLAAESRLRAGDAAGALALAKAAAARFSGARGLVYMEAECLLAMRENVQAAAFLEDQVSLYRGDPALWRMLARAYEGQGKRGLAHRAAAEQYLLTGGWLAAIEQLRLAQRAGGLDFYVASQVDARLRELQAEYQRQQQDKEPGKR